MANTINNTITTEMASKAIALLEAPKATTTASTTPETTNELLNPIETKLTVNGVKSTLVKYHSPNKKKEGRIGIALEARHDFIIATVKGVKIVISENSKSKKCKYEMIEAKLGYSTTFEDKFVENMSKSQFNNAKNFLESTYCLTQKNYSDIQSLALNGNPLMTKKERLQAEKEAKELEEKKALEEKKETMFKEHEKANVIKGGEKKTA